MRKIKRCHLGRSLWKRKKFLNSKVSRKIVNRCSDSKCRGSVCLYMRWEKFHYFLEGAYKWLIIMQYRTKVVNVPLISRVVEGSLFYDLAEVGVMATCDRLQTVNGQGRSLSTFLLSLSPGIFPLIFFLLLLSFFSSRGSSPLYLPDRLESIQDSAPSAAS